MKQRNYFIHCLPFVILLTSLNHNNEIENMNKYLYCIYLSTEEFMKALELMKASLIKLLQKMVLVT